MLKVNLSPGRILAALIIFIIAFGAGPLIIFWSRAAPEAASDPPAPTADTAQAERAGRLLYQANCAICHGAAGRGDGPAALSLNPRPSDFTQHMAAGKHTDEQILLWIRDGFPGSAMPAWGQRLSEPQMRQLVAYLRTFAPPASAAGAAPSPAADPPTAALRAADPIPPLIFARHGNLWRSDGRATPPRQITRMEADKYAEFPALAPDGGQIAFIATSQGPITDTTPLPLPTPQTELRVMRADGSAQRVVWKPERGVLGLIAWAPDGRALYVGFADILSEPNAPVPDRLFQVVRVDPQTGAQQVALADARDLTFSRDGRRIAFVRWRKDLSSFTLSVAAPDGSGERALTSGSAFPDLYAPRFSPDGQRIIFMSTGGPPTDEQGRPRTAVAQPALDRLLGWLAPPTAEAHGAPWDLWSINADGSGLRRLTNIHEDTPMAAFAPDGRTIALMGAGGIYLLDADGANLRKIDPLGDHGGLDWGAP